MRSMNYLKKMDLMYNKNPINDKINLFKSK